MSPMKAMGARNRSRFGTNVFISLTCLLMIEKLNLRPDTCPDPNFLKTGALMYQKTLSHVDYTIACCKKEFTSVDTMKILLDHFSLAFPAL